MIVSAFPSAHADKVQRFRDDDLIASHAPVSARDSTDIEEKQDIKIEESVSKAGAVNQEDEAFEWREVVRGE